MTMFNIHYEMWVHFSPLVYLQHDSRLTESLNQIFLIVSVNATYCFTLLNSYSLITDNFVFLLRFGQLTIVSRNLLNFNFLKDTYVSLANGLSCLNYYLFQVYKYDFVADIFK